MKRLLKMNLTNSPVCDLCDSDAEADLNHVLLECDFNSVVNDWVIAVIFDLEPSLLDVDMSSTNILNLNFPTDSETVLAVTWFLSSVFPLIWRARQTKKPISLFYTRATLEAELKVLRKTHFKHTADQIENAINFAVS